MTIFFIILAITFVLALVAVIYAVKANAHIKQLTQQIKANSLPPNPSGTSSPSAPKPSQPPQRHKVLTAVDYHKALSEAVKMGRSITCIQDEVDYLNELGFVTQAKYPLTKANIASYRDDAGPDKLDEYHTKPVTITGAAALPIRKVATSAGINADTAKLVTETILKLVQPAQPRDLLEALAAYKIKTKSGNDLASSSLITFLADVHQVVPFTVPVYQCLPFVLRNQVRELLKSRPGSAPIPMSVPDSKPKTIPAPSKPLIPPAASTSAPALVVPTKGPKYYLAAYKDEIMRECSTNRPRAEIAAAISERLGYVVPVTVLSGYYNRCKYAAQQPQQETPRRLQETPTMEQMQIPEPEPELETTQPPKSAVSDPVAPDTAYDIHLRAILTKLHARHGNALVIICKEVNGMRIRTTAGVAFTPDSMRVAIRQLLGVSIPRL